MANVDSNVPVVNGSMHCYDGIDDHSPPGPIGMAPTKSIDENGDGQLSPERRRSTRASALKAQEKIKLKDDIVRPEDALKDEFCIDDDEDTKNGVPVKKRRLESGHGLDQYMSSFYIREEDGDVFNVSDESEISSLHESEVDMLKSNYEKILSRELSEEQKLERLRMIKQCEAELRLEEMKLTMLRKVKNSQLLATQKQAEAKKLTPNIALNSAGNAYKPLVAPPLKSSTSAVANGKTTSSTAASKNNPLAWAGLTPEKQAELLNHAARNPQFAAQALLMASKNGQAQAHALAQAISVHQRQLAEQAKEQKEHQQTSKPQPSSTTTATTTSQSNTTQSSAALTAADQAKAFAAQTPQQRAAAAKQAFRMQADKQLGQLPVPKAPPCDLFFIPNYNQPDFCYLVGLDIVVQRVLRDKMVHKAVTEGPYECEECGTDYTPSWKAIGTSEDELHLYCEGCVRNAQKKKIRNDQTSLLRRAYNKISSQEKDFDKQIADGKLDAALAAAAAQAAQQQAATSSKTQQAASSVASTSSASKSAVHSNGTSTPQQQKSSTPVPTPSSSSKTTSASHSTPQSTKKSTSSNSSNSSNNAQTQQMQMLLLQMLRQNPMMAMMMAGAGGQQNAAGLLQMWNPMIAQAAMAQAQQQARLPSNNQQSNMNLAAMQMLQAMQSGSGGNAAAQNAAMLAAMNPALMTNQQILRQIQQMSQNRNVFESSKQTASNKK